MGRPASCTDRESSAVMISDAFFPFPDVVQAAASAGIGAIIQPGGSLRDEESIKAADEAVRQFDAIVRRAQGAAP